MLLSIDHGETSVSYENTAANPDPDTGTRTRGRPPIDHDPADSDPICSRCRPDHAPLPPRMQRHQGVEALYAYQGPLAAAITTLKFSGDLAVAGPLGRMLARAPLLSSEPAWDIITPVPLHFWRQLERGFNQSELLARFMISELTRGSARGRSLPRLARLLARTRATRPQSDLPADKRGPNVARAFRRRAPVRGQRILVVDDVTTTGATLYSCMAALRSGGAKKVAGLALLRTLA